ncbi:hypothetical protein [Crocosphaera sp.]|uniref:hypothetical protein n=1 Tax=Crocosphaera sp. TaxID=2729996 RepID=UPI0026370E1C|nr:hypothetical protein [Crocosphaera sp.]MDJ0583025.1 hypothetical protein [Crocosphaera sp.]
MTRLFLPFALALSFSAGEALAGPVLTYDVFLKEGLDKEECRSKALQANDLVVGKRIVDEYADAIFGETGSMTTSIYCKEVAGNRIILTVVVAGGNTENARSILNRLIRAMNLD